MTPEKNDNLLTSTTENNSIESPARRELFQRFGKFSAYAAPFTVLAFSQKADAATGSGPTKGGANSRPRH
jgi:hypothetical protein